MRRFEQAVENNEFTLPHRPLNIENGAYSLVVEANRKGFLTEKRGEHTRRYPVEFVVGGKNVIYLFVRQEKGFLQTAPLAWNVVTRTWFDMAASGIRHFGENAPIDSALSWRDRLYTFNTSCYACHVSQLSTNYDHATDSYDTRWREPGINCETCHGPGHEHVRVCRLAGKKNKKPADLKIIGTTNFSANQINDLCATCHAKLSPITDSFIPGEKFFDHYDLTTLEHQDFYPDGRDLGENYTFTSWLMSPCLRDNRFDCMHCHTSSGRYRFTARDSANNACMPCHHKQVNDPVLHTHHHRDSTGSVCISCHMPKTEFGRMMRSDHSMRPPMPAASRAFGSPNACNICHTDKSVDWADSCVRQWRSRDFQAPVLLTGELVRQARAGDWTQRHRMYEYIRSSDRDHVSANSIVRLLANCPHGDVAPQLVTALKDSSALVRSSAARALGSNRDPEAIAALIAACHDPVRLVRINAAASLAGTDLSTIPAPADRQAVHRSTTEYLRSLTNRQDNYVSHLNRGNFYYARQQMDSAITSFQKAISLRPDFAPPLINIAMAYARMGQSANAEPFLRQALAQDPTNTAALVNLGLLYGEQRRYAEARKAFESAYAFDSTLGIAAHNLGILLSESNIAQSIEWCRRAVQAAPDRHDYRYTLGYYLLKDRRFPEGRAVLEQLVAASPQHIDGWLLLSGSYLQEGSANRAATVIQRALKQPSLTPAQRSRLLNSPAGQSIRHSS